MSNKFTNFFYRINFAPVVIGFAVLILLAIVAFPMILVFIESFLDNGKFTLEFLKKVFSEPANYSSLANTLKLSILTVLFGTIIGSFFAWLVARTDLPFKEFFKTAFLIPYMIPPFIGAIAWGFLLSPRTGYYNVWFMKLFNTLYAFCQSKTNLYTENYESL